MPQPPPDPERPAVRQWWTGLADLLLPVPCAGCGRAREAVCGRCRALLGGAGARRVRLPAAPPGLPPVFTAAEYGGAVRKVLLTHKERGALRLGRPLGEALAVAVRAAVHHDGNTSSRNTSSRNTIGKSTNMWKEGADGDGLLLVPVPSARHSVKVRGHDATRRIAFAASAALRGTGLPVTVLGALRQRRPVLDQADLDPWQRLANVVGAFGTTPANRALLRARRVIVVDDLLTTGASLCEATRALREAGAHVTAGATVAAATVTAPVTAPVG
jgi:predicted amidophosphoribosyltransferase